MGLGQWNVDGVKERIICLYISRARTADALLASAAFLCVRAGTGRVGVSHHKSRATVSHSGLRPLTLTARERRPSLTREGESRLCPQATQSQTWKMQSRHARPWSNLPDGGARYQESI